VAASLVVGMHPRAIVSATAQIVPGSVVLAAAVVNATSFPHTAVLVNSGAVVDHDVTCAACRQPSVNGAIAGSPASARSHVWGLAKCSAAVKPALPLWNYRPVRRILPRG
jgi:carbonic anhydrase/acetyltransferase-like protein (isoleucine patch superfamily)